MRVALIADLHGNRPATEALEQDLAVVKPDRVLCLGDIVGKGPSSDFTFDWAMAHCDVLLGGNWDYGIGKKAFAPDGFYWSQLGEKRLQALRELPMEMEAYWNGLRVRLFHGRPVMKELVVNFSREEAIMPFFRDGGGAPYDAVIYADAHRQGMRTVSPGLFINVGSVGNALGVPRCCYALLDVNESKEPAPFEVRLRQLPYDREQAVRDAEQTPRIAHIQSYITEIKTGVYSRPRVGEV